MDTTELEASYGTLGPAHDAIACASAGGACRGARHVGAPLDLDPVDVFAKLVREVDAGRALVTMTPAGEQRRAALDALDLARCVLDDARELLEPAPVSCSLQTTGAGELACACGEWDGQTLEQYRREHRGWL